MMAALAVMTATAGAARADSRVEFLADRLRYPPAAGQADDFRVRTNAALALGATNDDDAVAPLCGGLDDPSEVVRQAVAVALKRLGRTSSLDCLRGAPGRRDQRVGEARRSSARIDALVGVGGGGRVGGGGGERRRPRSPAPSTTSPSRRSRTTPAARPPTSSASSTAPSRPSSPSSASTSSRPPASPTPTPRPRSPSASLKGYYLSVSVDKFDYSDGNLRVRVKIAVSSYPGKDLRGEVPAAATLPGARPGDTASEDQLMAVVAARAAELFAQNFR